jgi:CRP-like cAMP-binding protein
MSMNSHPALGLVDACPPLSALSLPARLRLAEAGREVRYADRERIVSIAKPLRDILILLEGWAKLVGVTEEGVERILYLYRPCEIIGSRILLQKSAESPFEVVAMDDVLTLAIPKKDFVEISEDHPELIESVTRVLLNRVDRLMAGMLAAMSVDASLRLSKLLLDFADQAVTTPYEFVPLDYSPTHETLAQIIGASRPHTTTLLRQLENEGAVRRLRPRGLMVCPAKLEERLRRATMEDSS